MQQNICFDNGKGIKLHGILSNSKENEKGVVILCHGHASTKDSRSNKALEQALNQKNIATFRFDFFGHGESGGKFEDATISEAAKDILCAIQVMKKQGYKKIGLVGSSFGGTASITAASKSSDLCVLTLRSAVANYEDNQRQKITPKVLEEWKKRGGRDYESWEGKKMRLSYAVFEDAKKNDGYENGKKIMIPTLIVHGDKDKSVPVEQSIKLSKIIQKSKLAVVSGADHGYTNQTHFETMVKLIADFIGKNIE